MKWHALGVLMLMVACGGSDGDEPLVEDDDGSGVSSCAECASSQICISCSFANTGSETSCVDIVTSTATQFSCGDVQLCDQGTEVCGVMSSVGDGCSLSTTCRPLPSECASNPTCECVQMHDVLFLGGQCSQDAAGNITVTQ